MNIEVREATKSDIDNIIQLWYELQLFLSKKIKGISDIILPEDLNSKKEHYNIVFNSDKYNVFVMECDNKLVGFMEVGINDKDFEFSIDKYGYIAYFYVKDKFRVLSSSIKLYIMGENWIREKGIKYICSDVDGENMESAKLQQRYFGLHMFKIRMAKKL